MRVLLVEDEGRMAQALCELLRQERYDVDCFAEGAEGLCPENSTLGCGRLSVRLSDKEYRILEYLISNRGQILTREQLALKIWGYDSEAEYNNVEVYMSFVRKKLNFVGSKAEIKALAALVLMFFLAYYLAKRIRYENERMSALISQLLELARTENVAPKAEALDLSRLACGEALPFESVAFEAGLSLCTQIEEGITLTGDADELRQLCSILLDNAIRHSPRGGRHGRQRHRRRPGRHVWRRHVQRQFGRHDSDKRRHGGHPRLGRRPGLQRVHLQLAAACERRELHSQRGHGLGRDAGKLKRAKKARPAQQHRPRRFVPAPIAGMRQMV